MAKITFITRQKEFAEDADTALCLSGGQFALQACSSVNLKYEIANILSLQPDILIVSVDAMLDPEMKPQIDSARKMRKRKLLLLEYHLSVSATMSAILSIFLRKFLDLQNHTLLQINSRKRLRLHLLIKESRRRKKRVCRYHRSRTVHSRKKPEQSPKNLGLLPKTDRLLREM